MGEDEGTIGGHRILPYVPNPVVDFDGRAYDVSRDAYDRATITALQLYDDHAQMRAMCDPTLGGIGGPEYPQGTTPRELAGLLVVLRGAVRDGEAVSTAELAGVVRSVARTLYRWDGKAEFFLPPGVWEQGAGEPQAPPPAPSAPADLSAALAPLARMIRVGYETAVGGMVHQSEAARRLGITPRGVALRLQRGVLRHVKVGERVLIPVEDVGAERAVSLGRGRNLRMIGYARATRSGATSPKGPGGPLTRLVCVCGEATSVDPGVFKQRGRVVCAGCGATIKTRNLAVYEMA